MACRSELCRQAASEPRGFLDFCYHFIGISGNYDDRLRAYCARLSCPSSATSPVWQNYERHQLYLPQAWREDCPPSGDDRLDELLDEAVNKFLGKNPLVQKEAWSGIPAGGTFAGAIEVAASASQGSTILCMLPDPASAILRRRCSPRSRLI